MKKAQTAVRDFGALRAAIDANPNLYSARLSGDHQAIMSELNKYLPSGKWVTLHDVGLAMALRPVERPTLVRTAVATAVGRSLMTPTAAKKLSQLEATFKRS